MDGLDKNNIFNKVYDDIFSPIAKSAGVAIDEVGKTLIFNPIYNLTTSFKKRFPSICARISEEIPEKELKEASPNITFQCIQGLCLNDDNTILGEMFYNILKSSVDIRSEKYLSPAFPFILNQLSRDECVFLVLLSEKNYRKISLEDYDRKTGVFSNRRVVENKFPIDKFDLKENIDIYDQHLFKLCLSGCYETDKYEEAQDNEKVLVYHFEEYRLQDFGRQFCKVCITDKCKNFI